MSFPVVLELDGRSVLVIGGDAAALVSITGLLAAGARVTVVATETGDTIADLATRGLISLHRRGWRPDDLAGQALVIAATDDPGVLAAAREHGLPVAPVSQARASGRSGTGRVVLVGGGPGDPGLLTVAGLAAIQQADVIVCDRLAPLAALSQARPDAVIVDVAKIPRGAYTPQEQINDLLVSHARAGAVVVRFKGGDNFVFGRGGEEWQACAAAGIPVTVIPGVSSAVAGPALAGIPLTHRQLTQGFTVVSGHLPPSDPGSTLDWPALARANTTLVIMMGLATLPAITTTLIAEGLDPATPAATVADAGLASQRLVRGTLADIADQTRAAELKPPAITVIGAVAGFSPG